MNTNPKAIAGLVLDRINRMETNLGKSKHWGTIPKPGRLTVWGWIGFVFSNGSFLDGAWELGFIGFVFGFDFSKRPETLNKVGFVWQKSSFLTGVRSQNSESRKVRSREGDEGLGASWERRHAVPPIMAMRALMGRSYHAGK
jgi:hypothetical protein